MLKRLLAVFFPNKSYAKEPDDFSKDDTEWLIRARAYSNQNAIKADGKLSQVYADNSARITDELKKRGVE